MDIIYFLTNKLVHLNVSLKKITKVPFYWSSVWKIWTENLGHLAVHKTDIK